MAKSNEINANRSGISGNDSSNQNISAIEQLMTNMKEQNEALMVKISSLCTDRQDSQQQESGNGQTQRPNLLQNPLNQRGPPWNLPPPHIEGRDHNIAIFPLVGRNALMITGIEVLVSGFSAEIGRLKSRCFMRL